MFAFHCPRHDARVLVWSSDVECIVSVAGGTGLVFHCSCGYRGLLIERPGDAEIIVPLDADEYSTAA